MVLNEADDRRKQPYKLGAVWQLLKWAGFGWGVRPTRDMR
jgi:hypothetical protein